MVDPWATGRTTVPVERGRTAADLGIETWGGMFTPLIARGTAVPATRSEVFTTADDNQPTIKVNVYWGGSDRVAHSQRVGGYQLSVPVAAPRGVPQLLVTFDIDAAGAFRLTATDSATGAPVRVSTLD
jgi:molecular chaperone DnaK